MTYLRKILALVLLLTGVLAFSSCYTLKFNPNNDAIRILLICKGDNLSLNEAVNESDALKITEILNGKHLYKDNPSCGFTEKQAIVIHDNKTFCIAMDECPILYYKEEDKYLRLSEEEYNQLLQIIEQYGFVKLGY